MGRPPMFSEEQILTAATEHIARDGSRASVASLSKAIGAPSGSIYHRFPSRDRLVAEVWLRAVRAFQRGYLACLADADLDRAALAAARHVPTWCGTSMSEAIVLHRHRLEDLVDAWPQDLAPDRDTVNRELYVALRRHARQRYGTATGAAVARTTFALVEIPGASVHRFLDRHQAPPDWSVDAVGVAALAVLRTRLP
jgi:AcrR family transcriptional regulator